VCEEAAHRSYLHSPRATNVASISQGPSSAQPRALEDHIGPPLSPRGPFGGHPSSADEDTTDINDGSASEPSVDSEATISDCNEARWTSSRDRA
jgi:hypothetical protein